MREFWARVLPSLDNKLLYTGLVLALAFVLVEAGALALRVFVRDEVRRHVARRCVFYASVLLCIILLGAVWVETEEELRQFITVLGAGLAIALHHVLLCGVGWCALMIRRHWAVGDRVSIDGMRGDVVDISLFHTTLLEVGGLEGGDQSTGRLLIVPNSKVFTSKLLNDTRGFPYVWHECAFMFTFESDLDRARSIVLGSAHEEHDTDIDVAVNRAIREMRADCLIREYKVTTPGVYTRVADSGVIMILRFLCPSRARRVFESRVSGRVLRKVDVDPTVNFAYPTVRYYDNPRENQAFAGHDIAPRRAGSAGRCPSDRRPPVAPSIP